jgi:hypothetical protein
MVADRGIGLANIVALIGLEAIAAFVCMIQDMHLLNVKQVSL